MVKHAAAASLTWHALAQARLPPGALHAATPCGDCGCVGCDEHTQQTRAVSLRALLDDLPLLHDAPSAMPPLLADEPSRQTGFSALDDACIARILAFLDLASLRAAAQSCRALAAASRRCAPGLCCTLYAHQAAALDWMLLREAPGARVVAPLALGGAAGEGDAFAFVATSADGPICAPWAADCPALDAPDARGGFYCDEPGLGKTVSILALLLRTRGAMAAPPADVSAVDAPMHGPPMWYDVAAAVPRRRGAAPPPPRRVVCTRATLVVVPDNLISHWQEQAALHAPELRVAVKPDSTDAICGADLVLSSFEAFSAASFAARSPLLAVRWLRVVLDEGHTIWSASITNRLANLQALHAERRWVMTGTPAPDRAGTGLRDAATTLLALLQFVRDPQYGTGGKGAWSAAVLAPLTQGRAAGVQRLRASLLRLMARATKACLRDLPPCVKVCTRLDFTPAHAAAYNQLVLLTMRALLLADWGDERCAESLLHHARAGAARTAVAWVRQACSVTGTLRNNIDLPQVGEAIDMLVDADSDAWRGIRPIAHDHPRWARPSLERLDVIRAAMLHGGACEVCGDVVPVVLVTPCAHITCVPCGKSSQFCCPLRGCGLPYTMQHGRVPQDFVELQPAMVHAWQSDWHDTRSSKVQYVLASVLGSHPGAAAAARARALRWRRDVARAMATVEQEHAAVATAYQAAADAHAEARAATGLPPAPMPPGVGPPPPRGNVRHKCQLAAVAALREAFAAGDEPSAGAAAPPKFILYSPFLHHLQLFATHLAAAGVRFAWLVSAQNDAAARRRNVAAFKADASVNVLLMDKAGVLGHDLSCASRVVLLEPVRDAAEEHQVVARAHRLGCRAAEVRVETLAMRGTAEEQLLRLCEEAERRSAADTSDADANAAEPADSQSNMQNRELLRALAFVRPAAAGAVEAPLELEVDDVAHAIEAVLTNPGEHVKTLPQLAERVAGVSCTPRRVPHQALGPVSPDMPARPPFAQHAMSWA